MNNANKLGFMPGEDAFKNSAALQKAVNLGGDVIVTVPGVYDISEQIVVGDDTTLYFGAGVVLRRCPGVDGKNGFAIVNKGAFTRTYNKNIKIIGLNLVCNGIESSGFGRDAVICGMRAHLAFLYVKNLEIRDFECKDLLRKDYAIQISSFENILVENVRIEGMKDGVHLGKGRQFVIRHGKFRTYDDPIALNAFDYSVSNPNVGWIEDGIIEDCYDLEDDSTVGFFCRILGGSWLDWHEGMTVMHSDTVVHNGRVYRVVMDPTDGKFYTSITPPTHTEGVAEYDGIAWVMAQEGEVYNCGCRNIHFRDIYLEKTRSMSVIGIDFNRDTYARSFYPQSTPGVQGNFILENINFRGKVPFMIRSNAPVDNIKIINSELCGNALYFQDIQLEGLEYNETNVIMSGVTFKNDECEIVRCEGNQRANVKITSSLANRSFVGKYSGNVEFPLCDIKLKKI